MYAQINFNLTRLHFDDPLTGIKVKLTDFNATFEKYRLSVRTRVLERVMCTAVCSCARVRVRRHWTSTILPSICMPKQSILGECVHACARVLTIACSAHCESFNFFVMLV
jgi:hypothetical protein